MSRYALHVYAFARSTPLTLQATYMKVLYGGCAAALSGSLGFFAAGNVVFGCVVLIGFLWSAYQTFKSWKTLSCELCAGGRPGTVGRRMTAGTCGGGTFGWPWGGGIGGYIDSHGRLYPQAYAGTPGWGLSAGIRRILKDC
ncbi:hypothetical protein JQ604_30775 [Bradyrhizobium jicamae]|uniref:hypothetical protein n=1 Tax=Bradyrhizobium jicamae TaxID=280332 RepID=UPI001BA73E81|nr:hypothetical protein [Bradyrhizobium jicamae]MBR0756585.1 hypothetical protein [Bradyrhizobium jicamae]